jgi:dienelactone hydrolase
MNGESMATAWRTGLLNVSVALFLAYAMVVVLVFVFQGSLLYYPPRMSDAEAASLARAAKLQPWRRESLRGYVRAPAAAARATVVVFHGNAGAAVHRDAFSDALVPLGFRVVLAEYPGFAGKPGEVGEAALVADAVMTLEAVRAEFSGPVIGWGESLGAGVLGAALAVNPGLVDGLVLLTPWDALAEVAAHHYPWLPVRPMLRDSYDSVANLRGFAGPQVVLLAAEDRVIPPRFGRRLFESLAGQKTLRVFPAADHNSWPFDPAEPWWDEVMRAALPKGAPG